MVAFDPKILPSNEIAHDYCDYFRQHVEARKALGSADERRDLGERTHEICVEELLGMQQRVLFRDYLKAADALLPTPCAKQPVGPDLCLHGLRVDVLE